MGKSCVFIRAIHEKNKNNYLKSRIDAIVKGKNEFNQYFTNPETFKKIPGSPFAYWASERIRNLFIKLPSFEGKKRTVKQGLSTSDDFRFVRLWWEIHFAGKLKWVPFSKGGEYSPYYSDIPLVINWENDAQDLKTWVVSNPTDPGTTHWSRRVANPEYYFKPGLTWSLRTQIGFSFRICPEGCIFGHKGPLVYSEKNDLWVLLGIGNSSTFSWLLSLQMAFGSYEVGVIQRTPLPEINPENANQIILLVREFVRLKQSFSQQDEISHIFSVPNYIVQKQNSIRECIEYFSNEKMNTDARVNILQNSLDSIILEAYSISCFDKKQIEMDIGERPSPLSDIEIRSNFIVASILSYIIGCVFGRWDIRNATGEKQSPSLPDPFAPLPSCSPGMLQGDDGLPLTESPNGYPLKVQWNGILVEDPGHSDDIVLRIREVLRIIYGERAEEIEAEACSILGVSHLAEYFKRMSAKGFFDDHIKKYSKSRRKAPIYWKISSNKGNYSIWLYYHRITRDTLFQVLKYVDDKVNLENSNYEGLKLKKDTEKDTLSRSQLTKLGKEIETNADFINELKDFREKLEKIAKRGYDPDFDDGVILNMAPLHEVIPWKEPRAYWEDLEKGKFDWAHIAMKYWPDRVREKCKKDKSIAIAHGLENLYEAD